MKKSILSILLTFTIFLPVVKSQDIHSQPMKLYYWFEVKAKSIIHEDTKKPALSAKRIAKKIYSGTFIDFIEFYKSSLKENKLAIGPFQGKETAKLAQKCYKGSEFSSYENVEKFINDFEAGEGSYYYFFSKLNFDEDGSFIIERIPARVANGSVKDFLQVVNVGLPLNLLAMGPFSHQLYAEKAKYVSRKYGEPGTNTIESRKVSADLKTMAEKWGTIKIKVSVDENNQKAVLNITFPPQYFKRDAAQYIEAVLIGNEAYILGQSTIQGEKFEDNNPVIPFEKESNYELPLKMDRLKKNTSKIVLKSTIITDTEMIKCKSIELVMN